MDSSNSKSGTQNNAMTSKYDIIISAFEKALNNNQGENGGLLLSIEKDGNTIKIVDPQKNDLISSFELESIAKKKVGDDDHDNDGHGTEKSLELETLAQPNENNEQNPTEQDLMAPNEKTIRRRFCRRLIKIGPYLMNGLAETVVELICLAYPGNPTAFYTARSLVLCLFWLSQFGWNYVISTDRHQAFKAAFTWTGPYFWEVLFKGIWFRIGKARSKHLIINGNPPKCTSDILVNINSTITEKTVNDLLDCYAESYAGIVTKFVCPNTCLALAILLIKFCTDPKPPKRKDVPLAPKNANQSSSDALQI